jgi:hypothetical protein
VKRRLLAGLPFLFYRRSYRQQKRKKATRRPPFFSQNLQNPQNLLFVMSASQSARRREAAGWLAYRGLAYRGAARSCAALASGCGRVVPSGLCSHCRFVSLRGGTTKQSRTSTSRGFLYGRKNTEKEDCQGQKTIFLPKGLQKEKKVVFSRCEKRRSAFAWINCAFILKMRKSVSAWINYTLFLCTQGCTEHVSHLFSCQ